MTLSSFLGSRQARIRLAETWLGVVLKEVDENGRQGQDHRLFSNPRLRTLAWCKVLAFGLSKNSDEACFVGLPPSCPRGETSRMSSKPASALPLVLTLESSNDSVIDGPSWISPQRETVETSEDLVRVLRPNGHCSKLKDDALAFLKEALMSKNHLREDYEELLRLSPPVPRW
ncbi:hypothetical protein GWK47_003588 [Chionoecetes opilio]|uniref:Uncharacterized protein n=1 Tax=Chionoecetes opilio TaxID=41210 RepID=A0A8J5D4E5_CHIOP|nr:hypothetical protein GWK47_003588 [Chionoecetes opilio]